MEFNSEFNNMKEYDKWRSMVSLMNTIINKERLYLSDTAIFNEYNHFEKNFKLDYIECFVEDFWNWYEFEYCNSDRLQNILNQYAKVIYSIELRGVHSISKDSFYDLYYLFGKLLSHVPAEYLL